MTLFNGVKKLVPQSIKNIYHLCQAILANFWYGFPSRKLKVIGVTGSDGKTTTVQMIAKILEEAGYNFPDKFHLINGKSYTIIVSSF